MLKKLFKNGVKGSQKLSKSNRHVQGVAFAYQHNQRKPFYSFKEP